MKSNERIVEFGDFQTPPELARQVCRRLADAGLRPASLLEPTCGVGNFARAALGAFDSIKQLYAADIHPGYVRRIKQNILRTRGWLKAVVRQADFFAVDWSQVIAELPEPILVLGNLPWVTNSQLGTLRSRNLPAKSNFHKRAGLDAVTGKANFDISEWMLIRLIEALNGRQGSLAMLCKTAVARKALAHAWTTEMKVKRSAIYRIDAKQYFGAAVDAALLVITFHSGKRQTQAAIFPTLDSEKKTQVLGFDGGTLLADAGAHRRSKHLQGQEWIAWRSGIKHDCAKVIELRRDGRKYRNGLGQIVQLERKYLFPLLKSSDVAGTSWGDQGEAADRWMIVPQKAIGEETRSIATAAPLTWKYLSDHAAAFRRRASSIYKDRPPFSIFGVGEYSFAPWKVAISGFYKRLNFAVVGPREGKPTVLDDTVYFLPCRSKKQADFLAQLLNSSAAVRFYSAFIFWDAKRPITAEILRRLDLRKLAEELNRRSDFELCCPIHDG